MAEAVKPGSVLGDGRWLLLRRLAGPEAAAAEGTGWLALDLRSGSLVLLTGVDLGAEPTWQLELTADAGEPAGWRPHWTALAASSSQTELPRRSWPLAGLAERLTASPVTPPATAGKAGQPTGGRAGQGGELARLASELQHDADPEVRLRAASRLGKLGQAGAFEPLVGALGDEDPDVRRYAAVALGRLGDQRAVGVLAERGLSDTDRWVAQCAAGALHRLGASPRQLGYQGKILLVDDEGVERAIEG